MEKEIAKKDVKVSVIIPVYNVEKYLERTLESVVFQTLEDIEIIIVNDGSTDNSSKVIEKFLSDKRVIYIKQENKGVSAARNKGLSLANGEYIGFVDSDDCIDNDFFAILYKAAKKNDADIAAASIVRKYENFEKWRVNYKKTKTITDKNEIFACADYPNQSYIWNKIYKKSFLEEINYKFEEGIYYEDVLATLKALKNCKKFVCVPDTNYYYLVNDKASIVKGRKTPKKEADRYNSQKTAIKTIVKNGIKIKRGEYFIKKNEFKFLNIPIFKIKEDLLLDKILFLLFNLIPVLYIKRTFLTGIKIFAKRLFSISKIDSHILIMFLFLKFKLKYKPKTPVYTVNESGINKKNEGIKLIASLTTFPARIDSVHKTIETLMNQTKKPDEIVLYLAKEQFSGGENNLPKSLLRLKEFGLTIKWTNDTKSYKKLIPALKDYPEDIIITFDDDIYYDKDTIETLYNSYLKHPDEIQANRIWRLEVKNNKIKPLDSSYLYWNEEEYREASFLNTIIGCLGVLYPPKCLYKDVLDEEKFTEIIPTQDDIWFWAMAVLQGTKIRLNKGYSCNCKTVENTQKYGLCKLNNKSKQGISGKDGFNKIAEYYPEIINILKSE